MLILSVFVQTDWWYSVQHDFSFPISRWIFHKSVICVTSPMHIEWYQNPGMRHTVKSLLVINPCRGQIPLHYVGSAYNHLVDKQLILTTSWPSWTTFFFYGNMLFLSQWMQSRFDIAVDNISYKVGRQVIGNLWIVLIFTFWEEECETRC